ncbi:MAG: hypothetical protein KJ065_26935 [Anaerolineae bacterium]|nr:hypothetical protein [Anaerolineae bacterium]MCL4251818.1 hypothetical protein [Anaerolineae bacterium]
MVRILLVTSLLLLMAVPAAAQIPSPTPIPSATPGPTLPAYIPSSGVYNFLATAAANVNALPQDISAPGGVALLPNSDAVPLFSYAKWLWSGNSTRELLGEQLSPIGNTGVIWITLVVVLGLIWLTVTIATAIVKFVIGFLRTVRAILPI